MLPIISIIALLCFKLVQPISILEDPCEAHMITWEDPCYGTIAASCQCTSSTFNVAKTTLKSCDSVNLWWAYPSNNMTVTIETPYTRERQPYAIEIDNKQIKNYPLPMYRIIDGKEIKLNSTQNIIVEKSDSNYQVQIKFPVPSTVAYYEFLFPYNVTKV